MINNNALLGPWIRRFLLEHLPSERNLSCNTQQSYRDTLILLSLQRHFFLAPIEQIG